MKKLFTLVCVSLFAVSTFAELGYGVTLTQNDFNNNSTVVKKQGTIEWDNGHVRCGGSSNGISIGGPSWNWDDKYFDVKLANGVPSQLTFEWACNNVTSTQADWYVKESADGSNWTDAIWTNTSSSASWTKVTKDLKPNTRYLRFCFSGNFAGNYRSIKVTERIEMGTPVPAELDFGTVKVDADTTITFAISWTNLVASVTSGDTHFTVNPNTIGEIGAYDQTSTVAVTLQTGEAGSYNSTIVIEGRDKSAQVTVSGTVEKYDQSIAWEPAESYNFGEAIPAAVASSALDVEYEIANPEVLKFENGAFVTLYAGTTQITAKQAGNYKFNAAADVVRTITVVAPTTYGDFAQTTCDEPVVFNEKTYTETTKEDVNVGLNFMGGDSIVHVDVVINHASFGEDVMTIAYGAEETWKGIDLKDSTVGVHMVTFDTINTVGCDSIITLTLTVTKQDVAKDSVYVEFCEGDSVEYRGEWYKEAGEYPVYVEGEVCDTTIKVVVTVNPNTYETRETTVLSGHDIELPEGEWTIGEETVSGIYPTTQRPDSTVLTFFQYGQTEKGCEAVIELVVTLEPNTEAIDNVFVKESAEKFLRNGQLYIRRGEEIYTVQGERVE